MYVKENPKFALIKNQHTILAFGEMESDDFVIIFNQKIQYFFILFWKLILKIKHTAILR